MHSQVHPNLSSCVNRQGGTKDGDNRSLFNCFVKCNSQPTQRDMIWLDTFLLVSAAVVFVAGN